MQFNYVPLSDPSGPFCAFNIGGDGDEEDDEDEEETAGDRDAQYGDARNHVITAAEASRMLKDLEAATAPPGSGAFVHAANRRTMNTKILLTLVVVMITFRVAYESVRCDCFNTPTIIAMVFLLLLIGVTLLTLSLWFVFCGRRRAAKMKLRSFDEDPQPHDRSNFLTSMFKT